jgi:hypothetical protein
MAAPARAGRNVLLLYAVIAVFYGGCAALWLTQSPAYSSLLKFMSIEPVVAAGPSYAHPPMPFFDLEGVVSWSDCARRGVDVYKTNPCDAAPYWRTANYSPLLVDLPLERIAAHNMLAAGFVIDLAFLLLLPFVFRPRSIGETALAAAAICSHATFYAVERANIDVFVFTMVGASALASQRNLRGRVWLYAAALAGALIKFYPIVLGGLALRERPAIIAVIGSTFAASVAVFVWWYGPELRIVIHKIPTFHYFSDMFGAGALPMTLQRILALPEWLVRPLKLVFLTALAAVALRLSRRLNEAVPYRLWFRSEMVMLMCGSLIMVGCFLLQTNNSYRAIFLMFAMPGVSFLGRRMTSLAALCRWTQIATLVLLWAEVIRVVAGRWAPAVWGMFILREMVWWYVVTVLAAVILCFVRQSPALRVGLRLATRQTTAFAAPR